MRRRRRRRVEASFMVRCHHERSQWLLPTTNAYISNSSNFISWRCRNRISSDARTRTFGVIDHRCRVQQMLS